MNHKATAVILFVLYLILLGCMLNNQNMLAITLVNFFTRYIITCFWESASLLC